MKKNFLSLVTVFVFIIHSSAQNSAVKEYINTYKNIAINEMIRTGVPASITLAQGILESSAGQGDLVKQSNNHFGIKCKTEWTGSVVYHDDDKRQECFRSYPSAEDSYHDHSDFLKNRPYYASLFSLDPTDYVSWAKGLKKAGYATEKDYAAMLVKVIEDNDLEQYTVTAMQRMQNNSAAETYATTAIKQNAQPEDISDDATGNDEENNTTSKNEIDKPSYPDGIFSINHTSVMYAKTGTSLFALASNHNISYSSLLEFNDLNKTGAILNTDQLIFFERKPKKGEKDFHVVTNAETLEDISQEEGVRLENILQYNQLQKGMQPAPGEKIYLRSVASSSPKLLQSGTR